MRLLRLNKSVLEYLAYLSVVGLVHSVMCHSHLPDNLGSCVHISWKDAQGWTKRTHMNT